jgi:hypothetical protein
MNKSSNHFACYEKKDKPKKAQTFVSGWFYNGVIMTTVLSKKTKTGGAVMRVEKGGSSERIII